MTWPTTFAGLSGPVNLSTLDTMFNQVGNMMPIPCTASGSTTVILTPVTNFPLPSSYVTGMRVIWKQVGASSQGGGTGGTNATLGFTGLTQLPLYFSDGTSQVTNNLMNNRTYEAIYDSALNAGSGGWVLLAWPPVVAIGNLLTTAASGPPVFSGGGGGGLTLLNTLTASVSASLIDTTSMTSSYNNYLFVFQNLIPAVSSQYLQLQISTDGVTYASANHYGGVTYEQGNAVTQVFEAYAGSIGLTGSGATNGPISTFGVCGWMLAFGMPGITYRKHFVGETCYLNTGTGNAIGGATHCRTSSMWDGGSSAITAVKMTVGGANNITSGTWKIYGIQS